MKRWKVTAAVVLLLLALVVFVACKAQDDFGAQGLTGFTGIKVVIPTTQGTTTPGVLIQNQGVGASFEIRNSSGTPVAYWAADGSYTGGGEGEEGSGQTVNNWVKLAGPTTIATATPEFVVDSLGVSNIVEVRDAATPVWTINDGGAVVQIGGRTATGGDTVNNWSIVSAPTAIATATPAFVVDSLGVSNIAEIRDAATPVFAINNGGLVRVGVGGSPGVADGVDDLYVEADLEVDDELQVDGSTDLNGTGLDVDVSAAVSIDADTASNFTVSGSTVDLTIESELGEVHIKGDEANATGITLDANDAAGTGVTILVGSTGGLNIDGGMTDIGTGTCGVASGDNDLCVAGVVEIDGELELDGALDADSTANFAGTATFSAGSGDAVVISAGGIISLPATADISAYGYVAVGDGTPGDVVAGTDEQLYVEGNAEFDGTIYADGDVNIDGAVTLTQTNAAGASANPFDYTATMGIMDGSDTLEVIDLNLTGANHTGTSNVVAGISIDLTTPDPQVAAVAIDIDDTDFAYGIYSGDAVIHNTAQTIFDDFWGDALQSQWILLNGSDGQALDPAIVANEQYGVVTLVSGDADTDCATDCSEMNSGTVYQADQGNLVFEIRAHIDTTITNASVCVGLTDVATIEAPARISVTTVYTIASDFVAFCFDDEATTKQWYAIGNDNGTQSTGNAITGVGPTAAVYQVLRIEVDDGGEDARFYIDGTLVNTLTANVVTITDPLTAFITVDTNTTSSITVDVDYIFVSANRN